MTICITTFMSEKDENKNAVDISTQLDSLENIYKLKEYLEYKRNANYYKITIMRTKDE